MPSESENNHFPSPESCVMDHNYQDLSYDSISQRQVAPPMPMPMPQVVKSGNKIVTSNVFTVEANICNKLSSPLKHSNKVDDFKTNTTSDFFKIDTKMNSTDAYNLFMK